EATDTFLEYEFNVGISKYKYTLKFDHVSEWAKSLIDLCGSKKFTMDMFRTIDFDAYRNSTIGIFQWLSLLCANMLVEAKFCLVDVNIRKICDSHPGSLALRQLWSKSIEDDPTAPTIFQTIILLRPDSSPTPGLGTPDGTADVDLVGSSQTLEPGSRPAPPSVAPAAAASQDILVQFLCDIFCDNPRASAEIDENALQAEAQRLLDHPRDGGAASNQASDVDRDQSDRRSDNAWQAISLSLATDTAYEIDQVYCTCSCCRKAVSRGAAGDAETACVAKLNA
ncbi:unnamed protein product, partial [Prorocentrum cordatum]